MLDKAIHLLKVESRQYEAMRKVLGKVVRDGRDRTEYMTLQRHACIIDEGCEFGEMRFKRLATRIEKPNV